MQYFKYQLTELGHNIRHYATFILLVLSIIGTILFPLHLWIYSFAFYVFLLLPLVSTTFHDYISHEYIKPKNIVIETILLVIFIFYWWTNLSLKKNYHYLHHKYTYTDKDPTWKRLQSSTTLQFMFDLCPKLDLELDLEELPKFTSPVWIFFDKYYAYIPLIGIPIWLMFLPLWTFFTFYIFPSLVFHLMASWIDIHWHKHHKLTGADNSWFVLVFSFQAWHEAHHKQWKTLYQGPAPWKYLNPSFYAIKLFFNEVK